MDAEGAGIRFVSLLPRHDDAAALAQLIDGLRFDTTPPSPGSQVPHIRGAAFFRTADGAAWTDGAPHGGAHGRRTVFLLLNEPGLAELVRDIDAVFIVGVTPGSTAAVDPRWHLVHTAAEDAPLAVAETAMRIFTPTLRGGDATLFDPRAASLLTSIRSALRHPQHTGRVPAVVASGLRPTVAPPHRSGPRARPLLPPLLETVDVPLSRGTDPFDLLLDASTQRSGAAAPHRPVVPLAPAPPRRAPPWRAGTRGSRGAADRSLANQIVARAPTIVVVGSRKGGVGKTSHAAGVAIIAGTVLDSVGHRAAIVDANIANPDAWGHFDLPPEASTVRSLAAALARGEPAPRPVNARTPALACFPETREGVEYSRTDVRRLAAHLRERFAFVVVDMSNRLPDPTAGPEAAAAAFWLAEADALVLPTACSRQDFNAVLDFLDIADLPPVVVPCLVPGARRNRRHPITQQFLTDIADRVESIVEIPDEADRVRLAGLDGVAVQDVSAALRGAYRRLTQAITDLPPRRRR